MKLRFAIITLAVAILFGCESNNSGKSIAGGEQLDKPSDQNQKISYTIGSQLGTSFNRDQLDIDLNYFLQGIRDVLDSNDALLTREEMDEAYQAFQSDLMAKMEKKQELEKIRMDSLKKVFDELTPKYMADFSKQKDVKETQSGLLYRKETKGSGMQVTEDKLVIVNYIAKLPDGTVFDDTYKAGKPQEFPVKALVPGMQEAMLLLKVGDKMTVVIPPALAYGEYGQAPAIPGGACLIFEIELLDVKDAPESDINQPPAIQMPN